MTTRASLLVLGFSLLCAAAGFAVAIRTLEGL